jgi:hypothetical protein
MEYMHKIKKMLCKELEEYGDKKSLSSADVEMIHKLTDTVKNLDKIEMLEGNDGYSETYPYYMGGSSYAGRGRGRNARRDSMGRYSSDMGSSYDDYSEERMDRRYSRDDAKDHLMHKLGEMMEDADPKQREALEEAMHKIRKA